jgi:hypothetical protein
MLPFTEYIIVGIFATSVAVIMFFALGLTLLFFFGRNLGIAFLISPTPVTRHDGAIMLACSIGILVSLCICPAAAFYLRDVIAATSDNPSTRIFLFAWVGLSQLLFIALAGISYLVTSNIKTVVYKQKVRAFNKLDDKLRNAGMSIKVQEAKILSDDGKILNALIKLRISNSPAFVPEYQLMIGAIGNEEGFFIAPVKYSDNRLWNPIVRAEKTAIGWRFTDEKSGRLYSETGDYVVLEIEFFRETARPGTLPKTIHPVATFRNSHESKSQFATHNFYLQTLPIHFEDSFGKTGNS